MSSSSAQPGVLLEVAPASWLRDAVAVVSGTALLAASAQISIPLPFSPVPLTLQTLGVLVVAGVLGSLRSVLASSIYFVAALIGLPVLAPNADGSHISGSAVLDMPTLGYVLGFVVASFVVGRLAEHGQSRSILGTASTMALGNLIIYAMGVPFLKLATGADWATAIAWGVTPFVIGDAIKIALAAGIFPSAWLIARRYLPNR